MKAIRKPKALILPFCDPGYDLTAAKEQVAALSNRAIQTMKGMGQGNEYLEELFISLIHREK